MLNRGIIVLPKLSSYKYKMSDEKRRLEKTVLDEFNKLKESGAKIFCIAEDMLAVELLASHADQITWITTLGNADSNFIKTAVDDYPELYNDIKKVPTKQEYIKNAIMKYKVPKTDSCKDQLEIRGSRLAVLNKRIRFTADKVLSEFSHIVYVDANNNFCSFPKPEVGDGKLVVQVILNAGLVLYTYGGLPIDKDVYYSIARSVV